MCVKIKPVFKWIKLAVSVLRDVESEFNSTDGTVLLHSVTEKCVREIHFSFPILYSNSINQLRAYGDLFPEFTTTFGAVVRFGCSHLCFSFVF